MEGNIVSKRNILKETVSTYIVLIPKGHRTIQMINHLATLFKLQQYYVEPLPGD